MSETWKTQGTPKTNTAAYCTIRNPGESEKQKIPSEPTMVTSNHFLRVFHVRFLVFDNRIEKLVKFYTKAIFFIAFWWEMTKPYGIDLRGRPAYAGRPRLLRSVYSYFNGIGFLILHKSQSISGIPLVLSPLSVPGTGKVGGKTSGFHETTRIPKLQFFTIGPNSR